MLASRQHWAVFASVAILKAFQAKWGGAVFGGVVWVVAVATDMLACMRATEDNLPICMPLDRCHVDAGWLEDVYTNARVAR